MPPDQDARRKHVKYEHINERLKEIEARIARLENMLLQLKKNVEEN